MKKKLQHTTVSVKLRKSEIRNKWYLYVEAYPVYEDVEDHYLVVGNPAKSVKSI